MFGGRKLIQRLSGAPGLAGFAVCWLAATIWALHRLFREVAALPEAAVVDVALFVGAVIGAALLAGAAVALAGLSRWDRRRLRPQGPLPAKKASRDRAAAKAPTRTKVSAPTGRGLLARAGLSPARRAWLTRVGVAIGLGLFVATVAIVGVLGLGGFPTRLGDELAGSIAVAAIVGAIIAALTPRAIALAGLVGASVAMVVRAAPVLATHQLTRLFGGQDTVASFARAQYRLALATSLLAGISAGLVAAWVLRRYRGPKRNAEGQSRFGLAPYIAAGFGAGTLSLVAELITRVAGDRLLANASAEVAEFDALALRLAGEARVNSALTVAFAGAVAAVIGYGIRRQPAAGAKPPAKQSQAPAKKATKAASGTASPKTNRPKQKSKSTGKLVKS